MGRKPWRYGWPSCARFKRQWLAPQSGQFWTFLLSLPYLEEVASLSAAVDDLEPPPPVSLSTACKDAATPAIPERLSAQNI